MTLPIPANTTCDVYHGNNRPPSSPDVAAVPCHLQERAGNIKPSGTLTFDYTHFLFLDVDADVRDGDEVYFPDQNGTAFQVQFVVRAGIGTGMVMRKAYIHRDPPTTWPNTNI